MTAQEFIVNLERLQSAASAVQAGLDRGGITATPDQAAMVNGLCRGLKRSVAVQTAAPAADRARLESQRIALLPRVMSQLPDWKLGCRSNDYGTPTLSLTRKAPLGPLSGAGLYGLELDGLEAAAHHLEHLLTPTTASEIARAARCS